MARRNKAPAFPGKDIDDIIVTRDEKHIEYRFLAPEERDYLCWMLNIPAPESMTSGIVEMDYRKDENIFNDFDSCDNGLPVTTLNGNYRIR